MAAVDDDARHDHVEVSVTVGSWTVRTRLGSVLAGGAVGALALAGCTAESGAAAVVDGRTISVDDLHEATEQLGPYLQDATPASVLLLLVAEPTFERAARDNGIGVSDQEAQAVLDQLAAGAQDAGAGAGTEFGPAAVDVARFTLLQQRLQQLPDGPAVLERVTADLADLDVEVNPRYGELDLAGGRGITPVTPDWLVPAADDAP